MNTLTLALVLIVALLVGAYTLRDRLRGYFQPPVHFETVSAEEAPPTMIAALGGVGHWSEGHWHLQHWNPEHWAELEGGPTGPSPAQRWWFLSERRGRKFSSSP